MRSALLLAVPILLSGCGKDEGTAPTSGAAAPSIAAFANLEVGNYWIYERGDLDSLNNYQASGTLDSVVVVGQGIINGLPSYMLRTHSAGLFPVDENWYVDGNKLLDATGRVLYCTGPADTTIWSEAADNGTTQVDWYLATGNTPVAVGTATLLARTWVGRRTTNGGGALDAWYDQASLWVPGVGRVLTKEMPSMWPFAAQRRLVRYHVQ